MRKTIKIIGVIAAALILLLGGYFAGSINNNEVSREIKIGYKNNENPNRIDFPKSFTDVENQPIIDNMLMIYLNKKKIANVNIDVENPDIYIKVISPREFVGLIDSKVWFTDEGAIIGEHHGEDWDKVKYFKVDESEANYIKEIIDYSKG